MYGMYVYTYTIIWIHFLFCVCSIMLQAHPNCTNYPCCALLFAWETVYWAQIIWSTYCTSSTQLQIQRIQLSVQYEFTHVLEIIQYWIVLYFCLQACLLVVTQCLSPINVLSPSYLLDSLLEHSNWFQPLWDDIHCLSYLLHPSVDITVNEKVCLYVRSYHHVCKH